MIIADKVRYSVADGIAVKMLNREADAIVAEVLSHRGADAIAAEVGLRPGADAKLLRCDQTEYNRDVLDQVVD